MLSSISSELRQPETPICAGISRMVFGLYINASGLRWDARSALLVLFRAQEQQVKDLGQQVAVLLNQVQTLQAGRSARQLPAMPATPSPSSAIVTSDDIISERLLTFTDIQVCTHCDLPHAQAWGQYQGLALLHPSVAQDPLLVTGIAAEEPRVDDGCAPSERGKGRGAIIVGRAESKRSAGLAGRAGCSEC